VLIDEFLPVYDVRSQQARYVHAPPKYTYDAVTSLDLRTSWQGRLLLRLRGLPRSPLTLTVLERVGFRVLGRLEGQEFVLGLVGRFWTPRGDLQVVDPAAFVAFDEKGYAKAVWNFRVAASGDGSDLSTETRVRCLDDWSRKEFRVYWMLIAPFSSKIREDLLRSIGRKAERAWRADAGLKDRPIEDVG
jgi:hypothetical protein